MILVLNVSANNFLSVPAIKITAIIQFINDNILKLLVLTQVSMGVIITSVTSECLFHYRNIPLVFL